MEQLGARAMLTATAFYLDPTVANPIIDTTSKIWHVGYPTGPLGTWVNGTSSIAVIQGAVSTDQITVAASVTARDIIFGLGGPYSLYFPAGASHRISGGTVSFQSTLTINVAAIAMAEINSTMVGAGGLKTTGTGTLIVSSASNAYSGGTNIAYGTLKLMKDPSTQSGAALGTGAVLIGTAGVLDLNGCPLTVSDFGDDATADGYGGTVTDTSSGVRGSPVGVTVLTIAVPSGQTDTFTGSIDDLHGNDGGSSSASIRLVKTGAGTLDLGGTYDTSSDFTGGTELDRGKLVLGSSQALGTFTDGQYPSLKVNGGELDLNHWGSSSAL
jgi:autotransporter-associated beta strand protein